MARRLQWYTITGDPGTWLFRVGYSRERRRWRDKSYTITYWIKYTGPGKPFVELSAITAAGTTRPVRSGYPGKKANGQPKSKKILVVARKPITGIRIRLGRDMPGTVDDIDRGGGSIR